MTQEQFTALTAGQIVLVLKGKTWSRFASTGKGTFYPVDDNNVRVVGSKTRKLDAIDCQLETPEPTTNEKQVLAAQQAAFVEGGPDAVAEVAQDKPVTRAADYQGEANYLTTKPLPHRLGTTDRVELINSITARVRNCHRTDGKRWVVDASVDPTTLEVPGPFRYTAAERTKLWQDGLARDRQFKAQLEQAEEATKPVETTTTTTKSDKPAKVINKAGGKARQTWDGLPPTGIIRTLASMGWEKAKIVKIINNLGLVVSDTTMSIQFSDGSKKKFAHGPALAITPAQLAKLEDASKEKQPVAV